MLWATWRRLEVWTEFQGSGEGFREAGSAEEESNTSRRKGMSPSSEVKCEVITDEAKGRRPPRPAKSPGHMPIMPLAYSLTRVFHELYWWRYVTSPSVDCPNSSFAWDPLGWVRIMYNVVTTAWVSPICKYKYFALVITDIFCHFAVYKMILHILVPLILTVTPKVEVVLSPFYDLRNWKERTTKAIWMLKSGFEPKSSDSK